MQKVRKAIAVPYSAQQMFDLVVDFESYPEFVPFCVEARVRSRAEGETVGTLRVSKGLISQSFTTKNIEHPHHRIDLALVDGPFRSLSGAWEFTEKNLEGGVQTEVSLSLDFQFSNMLLRNAFGPLFHMIANEMVSAFSQRAKKVYLTS